VPPSGGTLGEQNGDAVEDGIAARAADAAYEYLVQSEWLATGRTDQPLKIFLL
jgi:hypothetical protein